MRSYIDKYRVKKRCLFVNVSATSFKLINGYKLNKYYKSVNYSSNGQRDIEDYVEKLNVKIIIIDNTKINHLSEKEVKSISVLKMEGLEVIDAQHFYEILNRRVSLVKFNPHKYHVDDIFSIGISKTQAMFKRFLDLLAVAICLPFAIPLIIFGVFITKISSKGNVFFVQERIGINSRPFNIYKIRTMYDAPIVNGKIQKKVNRIGRLLRLTKIDELPQLLNILKGDMALIGPRPETSNFVEASVKENAFFDLRHLIRPGITGWAQVHLPKATPEDNLKKLEFDLYYIKHYSIWLDFETILRTIRIVLTMNSN
ncbi:sugar transferase [Chryseobacterium sp.]|uniref:sugar transferase n=1 Tax=Chryseobacterium sp. TaxID=1871047 RepID=UPI00388D999F